MLILVRLIIGESKVETNPLFRWVYGQRFQVAADCLLIEAQLGQDNAQIRERVRPSRNQMERVFVGPTRPLEVPLLLQFDAAREMPL